MMGFGLLNKSVAFNMKDGSVVLMKVSGIQDGFFVGCDDEGMNTSIDMDQIDTYFIPGRW